MKSLEHQLKNMQAFAGQKSIAFKDLCMLPDVCLPLGFKIPKFEMYDGHGNPKVHLKRYCNQLRGGGRKEELLMAYFGESLMGVASEWFMGQDTSRWEYATKWREQAARVKPPMDDHELIIVFLQAQELDYFQNMMFTVGKSFLEAIKIREMVENGLKTGRIISQAVLKATTQAVQIKSCNFSETNENDEETMMTSGSRRGPRRTSRRYTQPRLVYNVSPEHCYPP
ncbi:uncharacterized protein [Nicotiana tomentosiformis]|uniref:uncharacterized protein n=1 Tax=Nicotiana tomentosiformis TaxID=4098 RepID=UPI00388CAC1A